ncbi:o-succinylbenzoate synthase [Oscillatoriales cyanobacterium USR001]|nr:o-succinylbenzoate synthase [Oscillatoriales cyanobacterium USR001]
MSYQFDFRPYQRKFKQPLETSQGLWSIREGIIIRLIDKNGKFSFGEIAPIAWFGSETFEQAIDFCRQLPAIITEKIIFAIPNEFPACQFGFESAWENITENLTENITKSIETVPLSSNLGTIHSSLLPSGKAALQAWQTLWHQGYRTFKWKIGVGKIAEEFKIFEQLIYAIREMKKSAFLRLDANGGLSYNQACQWLQFCDFLASDKSTVNIEFIEQPLPVNQFETMLELSSRYSTPIALDESVATLNQLQECYYRGWEGVFAIKPCIAGYPSKLRKFCQTYDIDVVFSSVFETKIGREKALNLAAQLSYHNRALGFGVNHWFDEDEESWLEDLWKNS